MGCSFTFNKLFMFCIFQGYHIEVVSYNEPFKRALYTYQWLKTFIQVKLFNSLIQ